MHKLNHLHLPGGVITARTDRRLVRAAARSERFLVIDVTAPTVERDPSRSRPPVNIAFVLDRSGSMGGRGKLALAKQAVLEAIARLEDRDRFSVVVYDNEVDVVVPATEAGATARREAAQRLARIDARGSTALHGGWLAGCEQVAKGLASEGVNRALLLTDGLANVGLRDPDKLAAEAARLRARGIATSTLGVGTDFDEELLTAMADQGGGHFYFAGDVAQMRDHISSEVGDTLEVVARDVVIHVRVPAGVDVETLSPFRMERVSGGVEIHLGDLVSGQQVSIALMLRLATGVIGAVVDAIVGGRDREGWFTPTAAGEGAEARVSWTYADHDANDVQERDVEVTRLVQRLGMEDFKRRSVRMNREGRYAEAQAGFASMSRAIAAMAEGDEELAEMSREAMEYSARMSAPMPEMARKLEYARSANVLRQRTEDGKARKGDA